MKVLILANNDVGLYRFRKELIRKLIELGHEIVIALPQGTLIPKLTELGCEYVETPLERRGMNPVKDYGLLRQYQKLIKEKKPDMVICYTIKPNIYGGIAARKAKVPYCINITGLGTAFQNENVVKKLVVLLYKLACKNAKVVFFENEGNREVFVQEGIVEGSGTCRLNGAGVNAEEYVCTEYPKQQRTIRFLFIGRVMKEKGIEELIQAFHRLEVYTRDKAYDVQLDIVGPCEEEQYQIQLQKLGESGKINYYGFQEDVKPFIRECHCLVLPSYHEGMANTLLEAGAMGRPLITSDIHGCREALNGKNGYLVKCGDAQDLYEKMYSFTEMSYEEKEKMGEESHLFVIDKFSKEKVVAETLERMLG